MARSNGTVSRGAHESTPMDERWGGGLVGWGPGRGWPCVTQGLACVTETAETAETADRYMRFSAPTKETQPRSTKRNPNLAKFRPHVAVPWVLRRRSVGAARGRSTRKGTPGLPPRAAALGAIFGSFSAVFRPFFGIFAIFYRSERRVRCMRYTLK